MSSDAKLIAAMRANTKHLVGVDDFISNLNTFLRGEHPEGALHNPQAFFQNQSLLGSEFEDSLKALQVGKTLGRDSLALASKSQQEVLALFAPAFEKLEQTGSTTAFFHEVSKISAQLGRISKWTIATIVIPTAISLLANHLSPSVENALGHKDATHISKPVQPAVKPELIRFAISEGVRIRKEPSTNAEIISHLHRGQVVRVIKVENDWALITMKRGETSVTGWTYTHTLGGFVAP